MRSISWLSENEFYDGFIKAFQRWKFVHTRVQCKYHHWVLLTGVPDVCAVLHATGTPCMLVKKALTSFSPFFSLKKALTSFCPFSKIAPSRTQQLLAGSFTHPHRYLGPVLKCLCACSSFHTITSTDCLGRCSKWVLCCHLGCKCVSARRL